MLLMRQTAQPWSKARVGDKSEHVVVSEHARRNTVDTAEEEVVKHPVEMEDHIVMRRICPHIMPCTMRYGSFKHEGQAVLADEVRT